MKKQEENSKYKKNKENTEKIISTNPINMICNMYKY